MDDEEAVDWGYDESEEETEAVAPVTATPLSPVAISMPAEVEALLGDAPATVEPPPVSPASAEPAASSAASTVTSATTGPAPPSRSPRAPAAADLARDRQSFTPERPVASGAPDYSSVRSTLLLF